MIRPEIIKYLVSEAIPNTDMQLGVFLGALELFFALLDHVTTLYVTTSSKPTALLTGGGSHLATRPVPEEMGPARLAMGPASDGMEGLVDVSLAGCCGVQTTYGGLRITGGAKPPAAAPASRRQQPSTADVHKLRLSKFRHYLTL